VENYLYPHFYKIENEHWWFAARQKILWNFISRNFSLTKNSKVLDVGCGTGAILDTFAKNFDAYGQDVSEQAVDFCKQRGLKNVFRGYLNELPSHLKEFDLVTAFDVVEHIEDDLGVLKQMHSLLKKNGSVLITVPAFQMLWGAHDVVTHHKRRYIKKSLRNIMQNAGFEIVRMSYFNFFLFPVAVARRIQAKITKVDEAKDLEMPSPFVNSVLKSVFETEKFILPSINFPIGLSLIAVGRKK
jgi:2-polyprenyl-3-methyl-5-hydroxy-6-metoxy-1,4-benzoquinol methylase